MEDGKTTMMRLLLWLWVLCLGYGLGEKCVVPQPDKRGVVTFDYLMLVLQWPPGVALQNGMDPALANCHNDAFTLHGLWPSREVDPTTYPHDCTVAKYEPITDSKLLTSMQEHWPSFKLGGTNDEFWKHEWEKHGTCMVLPNQATYFTKTLNNRQEFVTKYQAQLLAKFPPSSTKNYLLKDMISQLGNGVAISCNKVGSEVVEITICLDKNGTQVRECPSSVCNSGCGEYVKLLPKQCPSSGWDWSYLFVAVALAVIMWMVMERRRRQLLATDSLLSSNSTELLPVSSFLEESQVEFHKIQHERERQDDNNNDTVYGGRGRHDQHVEGDCADCNEQGLRSQGLGH
ncbi:hypothetical protein BASA81_005793 [Batrachochytrium salamandrivorans]|nr:hypothetical protein BASA81_005793 [Batrachochytrium salamandrivorans]